MTNLYLSGNKFCQVAAIGLCMLLSACGGGGGGTVDSGGTRPSPEPNEIRENFLPLGLGNAWTLTGNGNVYQQRVVSSRVIGSTSVWVLATLDNDETYEELLEQRVDGIYSIPSDQSQKFLRDLGPLLKFRTPMVAGDRYSAVPERTLSAVADFDGDGKLDSLSIKVDVEVVSVGSLNVAGRSFAKVAHVRTTSRLIELLQSGAQRSSTAVSDNWYADQVGPVQAEFSLEDAHGKSSNMLQLRASHVGSFRTETAPPRIDGQSSTFDGKTNAPELWLRFDEPMDILLDVSSAIRLLDPKGQEVKVVPVWETPQTLRILTRSPWVDGQYEFEVTGALEDLAGNRFASGFKRSFTVDRRGPQVLSSEPANGAIGVPKNAVLRVFFDEPVYENAVGGGAVLSKGRSSGAAVAAAVTLQDPKTLVIRPHAPLEGGAEYQIVLEVRDATGNPLAFEERLLSFRVETSFFDLASPGAATTAISLESLALTDLTRDRRLDVATLGDAPPASPLIGRGVFLQWFDAEGKLQRSPIPATFGRYRDLVAIGSGSVRGSVPADLFMATGSGQVAWVTGQAPDQVTVTEVLTDVWGVRALSSVLVNTDKVHSMLLVAGPTLSVYRQLNPQGWDGPFTLMDKFQMGKFVIADIDGDGRQDIAAFDSERQIGIYLQRADGGFTRKQRGVLFPGSSLIDIAVGDLNGDGRADIVVTQRSIQGGDEMVLLSQAADGTFGTGPQIFGPMQDYIGAVAIGDVNGDGRNDAVIGLRGWGKGSQAVPFLQTPSGSLAEEAPFVLDPEIRTEALRLGDVNGDGHADLISGGNIHLNKGRKVSGSLAAQLGGRPRAR